MIIFIPGLLGSELANRSGELVWGMDEKPGGLARRLFRFAELGVSESDGIEPTGNLVGEKLSSPFPSMGAAIFPGLASTEPYGDIVQLIENIAAAKQTSAAAYTYDWRRSMVAAAQGLEAFVAEKVPPGEPVTLVCHSFGGLVARYWSQMFSAEERIEKIVTIGTPFGGSLKALHFFSGAHPILGRISGLREIGRSMPSLHETLLRLDCVLGDSQPRALALDEMVRLGAEPTLVSAAQKVFDEFEENLRRRRARVPLETICGVQQRTLRFIEFGEGGPEFVFGHNFHHSGDGTVSYDCSSPRGVAPRPLSQRHGALASSDDALRIVRALLDPPTGVLDAGSVPTKPKRMSFTETDFRSEHNAYLPDVAIAGEPFRVELGRLATCLLDPLSGSTGGADELQTVAAEKHTVCTVQEPGEYRLWLCDAAGTRHVSSLLTVFAGSN